MKFLWHGENQPPVRATDRGLPPEAGFPSTYIVVLPIFSSMTLMTLTAKDAVTFLSASIVTVDGFFVPERAPDQPVKT